MTTQTGRGRPSGRLEPGRGGTRHAAMTNGAPCKGVRKGLRPGATQGAPRRARQTAVVAVLQFGTCDVAISAHRVPPHPYTRQHLRDVHRHLRRRTNRASTSTTGKARPGRGASPWRMEGQCETRCGVSAAYRVTIAKTATTGDWARGPRGALRGPRPQVLPATFARRPVRGNPASRFALPRSPPHRVLPRPDQLTR